MHSLGNWGLHKLCASQSYGIADPSVDDSSTGRGVVLGRAATKLRSIETQPLTGGSTSHRLVAILPRLRLLFPVYGWQVGQHPCLHQLAWGGGRGVSWPKTLTLLAQKLSRGGGVQSQGGVLWPQIRGLSSSSQPQSSPLIQRHFQTKGSPKLPMNGGVSWPKTGRLPC